MIRDARTTHGMPLATGVPPKARTRSVWLYIVALPVFALAAYGGFVALREVSRGPAARTETTDRSKRSDPATARDSATKTVVVFQAGPVTSAESEPDPPPSAPAQPEQSPESPLDQLRASGPERDPWTDRASEVLKDLLRAAHPDVEVRELSCFRDGCIAAAVFPDQAAFEAVNHALPAMEEFMAWPGNKGRSPPVQEADGRIASHWIFYRPQM